MFRNMKWSQGEKRAARRAFDLAYERECAALIQQVQKIARGLEEPDDVWKLSDFIVQRRKDIDDTYDFRMSVLPQLLARLLSEKWISTADLKGLDEEKREQIRGLAEGLDRADG
jgi:hypothetical protein